MFLVSGMMHLFNSLAVRDDQLPWLEHLWTGRDRRQVAHFFVTTCFALMKAPMRMLIAGKDQMEHCSVRSC